jgi:ADP-heptose:LPS heptosyltransferase
MYALLRWRLERKYRATQLVFPHECGPSSRFLVIVPGAPVLALLQLPCVVSIAARFRGAHITVVCEKSVSPFFRTVLGIAEFIEYHAGEGYLFSKEFDRIGKAVSTGRFDVCIMLDHEPGLPLLYAAGQSAAAVRIGLSGAGDYPFLNLHVKPSTSRTCLTDKGMLVAATLGVPLYPQSHWSVTKESVEEVALMLREMNVAPSSRLAGIDGQYYYEHHGRKWTRQLLDMLATKPCVCYLFSYGAVRNDAREWAGRQNLPVFSDLPASRCAALIYKSEFVIAGPTVLFELADLLRKPAVGVFDDRESALFCRESDTTKGVRYVKRPDDETIGSVEQCIGTFGL